MKNVYTGGPILDKVAGETEDVADSKQKLSIDGLKAADSDHPSNLPKASWQLKLYFAFPT